jgi:DNA-directed RNA polymerase subunit beta'
VESFYNKINDYGSVKIRLASPEDIRSWSYGEVKKPETINYRTYRAEKDGLFCEKIFGPERDWECFCGKYKGIKHKGVICDRCGVTVTHSRVRRKRMGHINLAAPVSHIWFFKAMPSRMGTLLALKTSDLERIIYFQDYIVIDPGSTPLKAKQLLTEEEFRGLRREYGDAFKAGMGAEALRDIIRGLEFEELAGELREGLAKTKSKQRQKDIIKRLKLVESLRDSENSAEWMVLDVIPVIPPDLRPLVLLESGNFATSDLNDLYRRLINRNNRLKKLLDLNAPEVIIRNEKRMLQQSVDALFDNGRCRRPVLGSANRPLKSLTDMIKGKQGRFRENLLGKRVDYSARSVIVVGPELKLHQCGLPKKIALELFQPFVIRRLKELGYADTIKSAKKMLERKDEEVWDILDDVIRNHPVLLNRAPTLHRMGIQAFEPILIEGNAIRIHPLVCAGFNADFDGDQMAVHLPLSLEAQVEASTLMLSTHNVFSPAHGQPIIAPSQDIVLGCYYLTVSVPEMPGEGMVFTDIQEVFLAHSQGKVHTHARIRVRLAQDCEVVEEGFKFTKPLGLVETTVGRVFFNDIIPEGMPFYNLQLKKKPINKIISQCHERMGNERTLQLLDELKTMGFQTATLGGISFSKNDLRMPRTKEKILQVAQSKVDRITRSYELGAITDGERHNQVVDEWTHARERVGADMMEELRTDTRGGSRYLNPIYMMADSGARGSLEQIRQLAGMRGLMAKPSGQIIETPIKANFREGLKVLEYFSSTHGARKGLADTALKTADSGYLTRKLADVAQNVVINESNCGTLNGITKTTVYRGEKVEVQLADVIWGRVALETIVDKKAGEVVVAGGDMISEEAAIRIQELGYDKIRVRSPLTCETPLGLCASCYGMDLSKGLRVEEGLAIGIIAAQSIGEPGTQLTMRTFHIGGTAHKRVEESEFRSRSQGLAKILNVQTATNEKGESVVLKREGEVAVLDAKNPDKELERHTIPLGAILKVKDGQKVTVRQVLVHWDPFNIPILAEQAGRVRYEDIVPGVTMKEEYEGVGSSKVRRREIIEHKGDLHPQIIIEGDKGAILGAYHIPEKANIEVDEGQKIVAGTLLAKTAREITGTQDITGGLPRVTELFEARRPKNPAVISEIDGTVDIGEKRRGKRTILVRSDTGMEKEHLVPQGKHLRVHKGTRVKAGDPLVDGPLVLHDILRINGEESLQQYLLREIQNVYRSQNVTIDDKHIEIIIAQMMRKVRLNNSGDTEFLPGSVVDKFVLKSENRQVQEKGGRPASFAPLLLGITKASLQSPSFISAASFQETTKVLTEAALGGKVDQLLGLKENVILGHMIPAGTGFKAHFKTIVQKNVAPSILKELEDEAESVEEDSLGAEEEALF